MYGANTAAVRSDDAKAQTCHTHGAALPDSSQYDERWGRDTATGDGSPLVRVKQLDGSNKLPDEATAVQGLP